MSSSLRRPELLFRLNGAASAPRGRGPPATAPAAAATRLHPPTAVQAVSSTIISAVHCQRSRRLMPPAARSSRHHLPSLHPRSCGSCARNRGRRRSVGGRLGWVGGDLGGSWLVFVVWKLLGLPHSKQTSMEYLPFTHCFLQGFGGCIKEVFGEEELHEPPEAWTQPPGGMCQAHVSGTEPDT